jgi:exodeoxyribonuclease VII small subunit
MASKKADEDKTTKKKMDGQAGGAVQEAAGEEQVPLEEMFERMEAIVGMMETEEISLEESFRLYSEGMRLLKKCNETIDAVEKKVLVLDEDGEAREF